MDIKNTIFVNQAFASAQRKAESYRHEFIMPEHLLSAIIEQEPFIHTLQDTFYNYVELSISLENYLTEEVDTVPDNVEYELGLSVQLSSLLQHAYTVTEYSSAEELDVPHLIQGLLQLEDSWACHFLKEAVGGDLPEFLSLLITHYEEAELAEEAGDTPSPDEQEKTEAWRNYVTCLNDHLAGHNPLIGREMELERTIQVLCRKEKNNPLHVGEPGVGKTALAYGLAARIEAGNVPERLAGFRIYELDLGSLLAGTQYRGDFEKRLKSIMEGIGREGNAIVYIDEIHNLIGAGRTGEGSMDASNMLKPYLETGAIRFIGSTTYDEYNRYFARSKGLVRRFQQIDILEPSIEEAIHIVEGLKEKYETYHGVTYEPDVIPYAVKASARYISDRFLPDKAIDLVDEAGAYREIHPTDSGEQTVDKALITDILARTCKVNALAMKEDDTVALESLHERISSHIYGQEEAVRQVVEAVQMSKAGLLDENKPLASLLFVGPTGVGKTEVAKVLAAELGIALQRFDMSEYIEKHTVAKLIGSPAGYVGYEDGGLLVERMGFDLIDRRRDLVVQNQVLKAVGVEVRHTDGADAALAVKLLHGAPRTVDVAVRLVDQIEVQIVQPQLRHRLLERLSGRLITRVADPQFRGDEQLFAGNAAATDGTSHGLLVTIGRGGVDRTVTDLQGVADRPFANLRVRNLINAEAEDRHFDAVVQFYVFHTSLLFYFSGKTSFRHAMPFSVRG